MSKNNTCKTCKYVKEIKWTEKCVRCFGELGSIPYEDKEHVYLCMRFPPTGSFDGIPNDATHIKGVDEKVSYYGYTMVSEDTAACGEYFAQKE